MLFRSPQSVSCLTRLWIIDSNVQKAPDQTQLTNPRYLNLVRAIAYACLLLAIVGFALGIRDEHYALITVSFIGAVVAFLSAFAAGFVADLIFQWRTSLIRLAAIAALVGSIFGFSLGINFESEILLITSFATALASIAVAFNAPLITRMAFGAANRSARPRVTRARPARKRRR